MRDWRHRARSKRDEKGDSPHLVLALIEPLLPRHQHADPADDKVERHVGVRELRVVVKAVVLSPRIQQGQIQRPVSRSALSGSTHSRASNGSGDQSRDSDIVDASCAAEPAGRSATGEEMPRRRAEEAVHGGHLQSEIVSLLCDWSCL